MTDFLKRIADLSPKRLALLAAELEERVRELEGRNHAPIAIVGIGCRFPGGVCDTESFWKLLEEGRDAIAEVPRWRWNVDELYNPDPHAEGCVASRWGGFIDSPELFDPAFFGIAPVEAIAMDPQQRLLLEVAWEALEDAAIAPSSLSGTNTGVYMGLCNADYSQLLLQQPPEEIDAYSAQGSSHAVAAGRISYFLGLRGPSLAIDTACSSSLVAVHEACQSLRVGETDLALAGGVNLLFSPQVTMALSRAQMMASDGRCKAFSAEADGFVRSEGCGVVVLKRLDDATRDEDRIIAVIRGTALNQDGRSSGITAPNGPSQEAVIHAALKDAGIAPEQVGYVEAHGTGTNLGDPIELRALDASLGTGRSEDSRLIVGSVKSNFGHAEAAAGVAGLIKLALSLHHHQIPASLHFRNPNPAIDWEKSRLRVPVTTEAWSTPKNSAPRAGAVSSFGFSGTNAHLVVTEAPREALDRAVAAPQAGTDEMRVIALSARSETALRAAAARLADHLGGADTALGDVAYTLATGRSALSYRASCRPESTAHLVEELAQLAEGEHDADSQFLRGVSDGRAPRVAFLFAGQGGERTGMGLPLLKHFSVFRDAVGEVDAALDGIVPCSIETIFRNERDELAQSALVQPALFAFQYGMARLWQSWGVEPDILVGHSMGEILACTFAGVLSVADASRLVAARGRLTGELGDPGGMVAVAASEEKVLADLAPFAEHVSIAAINGPSSVVISGRAEPLEEATVAFERAGVRVKRLNITYGSHSPAMHRVLPAFYVEAGKAIYSAPRLPIIADLTGERVETAGTFSAQYFTGHLSRPVQFQRCLERLEKENCGLCIEMGPRAVLATFGKERGMSGTSWVASASGREEDFEALQAAIAEAFAAGAMLDWKGVFQDGNPRKVALPTYPFERERYWIEDKHSSRSQPATRPSSLKTQNFGESLPGNRLHASLPIWEMQLQGPLPLHLDQHQVGGKLIVPASFFLSLAWNAANSAGLSSADPAAIQDLEILSPLSPGDKPVTLQTALTAIPKTGTTVFRISSRQADQEDWTLHATGKIEGHSQGLRVLSSSPLNRNTAQHMRGNEFYRQLEAHGVNLGPAFRAIQEIWYLPGVALGRVLAEDLWHDQAETSSGPHPALLDACFQVMGAAGLWGGDTQMRVMTGVDQITLRGPVVGEIFVSAELKDGEGGTLNGSIEVRDNDGQLLATASGIALRRFSPTPAPSANWLYEQAWIEASIGENRTNPNSRRHWIVLGDPLGIANTVAAELMKSGESAESSPELSANPLGNESISGGTREVVDLRPLEAFTLSSLEAKADAVADGAMQLALQGIALWQKVVTANAGLWLFTQGAQCLRPSPTVSSAVQTPLWGLARCATLEHPETLRRIVDIDPDAADLVPLIVRELLSRDKEDQIAYLGSKRLAFRVQPSELHSSEPIQIRKDGSYLLTGGAGGLGLRVAAWLAHQGAGKLVLTSRSGSLSEARQKEIESIRANGIDVTVVQTDVADSNAMQQLFARFGETAEWPALRGIFHMAADINGAAVESITPEQVQSTFRAKVAGTWLLHKLSSDLQLDHFVAFSSTAAVLGAGNLGNYAAANSFLDAMASLRAAEGLPFTSISWGTWQTMQLASDETRQQYSSGGMLPMDDHAALRWLADLTQPRGPRQATVADVDWQVLAPVYESKRSRPWLEFVRPKAISLESGSKPGWSAEPGETRVSALERAVRKEAARVLGFRRGELPGSNASLPDLGLDSLMAVNLRNRLQAMIGHGLPPTFAFEFPTPTKMAGALDMLLWGAGVVDEESVETERDEIQI